MHINLVTLLLDLCGTDGNYVALYKTMCDLHGLGDLYRNMKVSPQNDLYDTLFITFIIIKRQ
jgi:hypothetical protein